MTEFKVPLKWVASDDCEIAIGQTIEDGQIKNPGQPYNVHIGEAVGFIQTTSMNTAITLIKLMDALQAPNEGQDQGAEYLRSLDVALDALCLVLSKAIGDWDWTDNAGEPLPKPYGHPEVIKALHDNELLYLVQLIQGQTPTTRKNGSRPSVSASSAMEGLQPTNSSAASAKSSTALQT